MSETVFAALLTFVFFGLLFIWVPLVESVHTALASQARELRARRVRSQAPGSVTAHL